jgi:imidazole glycerol-phosphate synthase subunit HisF
VIPRVIPTLLLDQGGLVKTVQFRDARYVGDPINTVRIFNDKQVDEIVLLDIGATREGRGPDSEAIERIASEAFMPLGYGGGVRDLGTATALIQLGVEKVIVNTAAIERPSLVREIADHLGSSTIVVSLDVARRPDGSYEVRSHGGTRSTGLDARAHADAMAAAGAGELILQSIDRDGTMTGYDLELIRQVASTVEIPVVAGGGAGSLDDVVSAIREGGAAAAAAGSLFVFHGKHRAVLVTYPSYEIRQRAFAVTSPA